MGHWGTGSGLPFCHDPTLPGSVPLRVISTYSYDGLNRLDQVGYALPNPNPDNVQATATVNVTYGSVAPKIGKVEEIKQTDSQSTVPWKENYSYDTLSRVNSKTVSFDNLAYAYTTGYGYNQAGQLTQMTYPSQKVVKYGFDARGRMQTLGDGSLATKYISSIGYQPSQQVGSISLNNGVTETYGYSADRLQLTSQTATKAGSTLMSLTYNYIADKSRSGGVGSGTANTGQLMDLAATIKDPNNNTQQRNESYNYDQVARLSQGGGFYAQRNYTYDRWGNRTGVTGGATQTVTLQQPGGGVTNNRIASVNSGPSYIYDAAGAVTNDGVHGYSYDAESRTVKVDSGSTATYSYDAANRRVKKAQGASTTYYVWEGSNVIAEYGDAPAGAGGTRFYHPDRLSNRMITNGSGVVKGVMDNLPFGEDGGTVGESEKHRFTSYERDSETASDYAVNRQYAHSTGRFLRPDPVAGSMANPQSLNRYTYTANDPTNLIDPDGQLLAFPILISLINFFNSFVFSYTMDVSAGGSSIDPISWGGGGGWAGGGGGLVQNPFPPFSKDDLKVVQQSIKTAQDMTKRKECDEALKDYGIPSLASLISGLTPNSNLFDGRSSTLTGPIGKNGATESVAAYFKENKTSVGATVFDNSVTGRGSVTFLGDYFFNPPIANMSQQRGIIVLHEAVHQVGGRGDTPFGGSKALSEKIIQKCYPVLKGKLGGVG